MELKKKVHWTEDDKEEHKVSPPRSTNSSPEEEVEEEKEEKEEKMLEKTPGDSDGGDSPVWDGDSQTDLKECRSETQTIDFQPSNSLLFDLD